MRQFNCVRILVSAAVAFYLAAAAGTVSAAGGGSSDAEGAVAKKSVEAAASSRGAATYRVKAGDQLEVSIWKEPEMRRVTLVLPDGSISYPLAGQVQVSGLTPSEIEQLLNERLSQFFKDPFLSVTIKETSGNRIYVLGQVRNPGVFPVTQPVDVMQALSLAGGLGQFADTREILVLRRGPDGKLRSIPFKYSSVQKGQDLSSNVILKAGDTVVVPEKGLF